MADIYEINIERLKGIAQENGLILNPDGERVAKVAGLMAKNYELAGEWICPCKQKVRPARKGADKVCPCPEWLDEIKEQGHCLCRLFYAEEKAV